MRTCAVLLFSLLIVSHCADYYVCNSDADCSTDISGCHCAKVDASLPGSCLITTVDPCPPPNWCGTSFAQCDASDTCCTSTCRFSTLQCRASADDCDKPEFCTGQDADCPADDDAQSETPVLWDWVGNSGQLKVWVPVCDESEAASQWIKIKFSSLQEVDKNGDRKGNMPSVNNLASQKFNTRILTGDEIDDEFNYDTNPRDVAQISTVLQFQDSLVQFHLTVMYFDDDSSVSWTDPNTGETSSYSISSNSVKFNIHLQGDWPWQADTNNILLSLDILWPTGKTASVSNGDDAVSVDISGDSLDASLSFPTGNLSPLIVDGEFQDVSVDASVQGSHVRVELTIPHFTQSVTYDPMVSFNSASGFVVNFVIIFSMLLYCLI